MSIKKNKGTQFLKSKEKKIYNNKDSWLEKVKKKRCGIKREFENHPQPPGPNPASITQGLFGDNREEEI